MTVNKKEKVLIFVLILFLLVGGTFTLGIMPKNSAKDAATAEREELKTPLEAAEKKAEGVNNHAYDVAVNEITKYEAELKKLASPVNNVYEEVEAGSVIGQTTATQVAKKMRIYMSDKGIDPDDFTIGPALTQNGRKIYSIKNFSFNCANSSVLYGFIDDVAKYVSYNITYLDFEMEEDGSISGTMSMSVTYLAT